MATNLLQMGSGSLIVGRVSVQSLGDIFLVCFSQLANRQPCMVISRGVFRRAIRQQIVAVKEGKRIQRDYEDFTEPAMEKVLTTTYRERTQISHMSSVESVSDADRGGGWMIWW